jgi:hypothetical protein
MKFMEFYVISWRFIWKNKQHGIAGVRDWYVANLGYPVLLKSLVRRQGCFQKD